MKISGKKNKLTLILFMVGIAVILMSSISLNASSEEVAEYGGFTITGGRYWNDYTYGSGELTILSATNITIENTNPAVAITDAKIVVIANANITLRGVNIYKESSLREESPFRIATGYSVNITLAEGSNNILKGVTGLEVPAGASLTIGGTGSLSATSVGYSGHSGAGIGSGAGLDCGSITINSGSVYAAVSEMVLYGGAGIGSGASGNVDGDITINGGDVTAFGGFLGAGIGSGYNRNVEGDITISGGNVNVWGGDRSAAIGSAYSGDMNGSITISGGTVTATKGPSPSGITPVVADIGGGERAASHGNFSTGVNGNAFVYGEIANKSNIDGWSGFMFPDKVVGYTHGRPTTITADVALPEGKTLNVNPGYGLAIPSGYTFTNNGTLNVNGGTLSLNGTFNNDGTLNFNGTASGTGAFQGDGAFLTSEFTAENVLDIEAQAYTGSPITPSVTFTGSKTILNKSFDFSLTGWQSSYDKNTEPGQATLTLTRDGSTPIVKYFQIVTDDEPFIITGGNNNSEYHYEGFVLHIDSDTPLTIKNLVTSEPSLYRIVVPQGVTANLSLAGVNIDVGHLDGVTAFEVLGSANINLITDNNILKSGLERAGLEVPSGGSITISGTGKLTATGGTFAAAIGSPRGEVANNAADFGSITINSGTVHAISVGGNSSAIGGGHAGLNGSITISGGTVIAEGAPGHYEAIGGWKNDSTGKSLVNFEATGNAFIDANVAIAGQSEKASWKGVIFEGDQGNIYGDTVTLNTPATVTEGKVLTIGEDKTLDISGATLTNSGRIIRYGTINGSLSGFSFVGDINHDDKIDSSDLVGIMGSSNYNKSVAGGAKQEADFNGDGIVNFTDLALVRNSRYFGR